MTSALIFAALLAAAPTEVVVQQGESLAQVAKRALGDERAAAELKALNGLSSDKVPAGTALHLPGPARARALSAIAAARNAVKQAGSTAQQREQASASLAKAEELIQAAQYDEAAAAADSAWRLIAGGSAENTRFAVEVKPDGYTQVSSRSGQAVRVEREGLTRPVYPGQTVGVSKGKPLAPAQSLLSPPVLNAPADLARLKLRTTEKGLGPLTLSWQPVPGAAQYQVEVSAAERATEKSTVLSVEKTEARIASLQAGRYTWSVRAVGASGEQSDRSPQRTFELVPDALKLEVKGTTWK